MAPSIYADLTDWEGRGEVGKGLAQLLVLPESRQFLVDARAIKSLRIPV
jgi:hypothetical protein